MNLVVLRYSAFHLVDYNKKVNILRGQTGFISYHLGRTIEDKYSGKCDKITTLKLL